MELSTHQPEIVEGDGRLLTASGLSGLTILPDTDHQGEAYIQLQYLFSRHRR